MFLGTVIGRMVCSMVYEGNGARQILGVAGMPVRSVVVGIVDEVG